MIRSGMENNNISSLILDFLEVRQSVIIKCFIVFLYIFQAGGFMLPFVLLGVVMLISVPINMCILPYQNGKIPTPKPTYDLTDSPLF